MLCTQHPAPAGIDSPNLISWVSPPTRYFEANPRHRVTSPWKWCFNCCLLISCLWREGAPSAQCGGGKVLLGGVISPVLAPTPQASPSQELARRSRGCGLSKHHEPSHEYTHIYTCAHTLLRMPRSVPTIYIGEPQTADGRQERIVVLRSWGDEL